MTTSYLTYFCISYEALGLVASLNPTASGGVERPLNYAGGSPALDALSTPEASASQQVASVPKSYGRIVRDQDGNIVDVVLPEEGESSAPIDDSVEDVPDPSQDEQMAPWVGLGSEVKAGTLKTPETQVVRGERCFARISIFFIAITLCILPMLTGGLSRSPHSAGRNVTRA